MIMPNIEIYTTAVCGYCSAAKNLLKSKGLAWQERRIDSEPANRKLLLERAPTARTVPQIFVNNHYVGGYEQLLAADRNGQLAAWLADGTAADQLAPDQSAP